MGDGGCAACGIGDRYIGSGPSRSAVVVGVVAVTIGAVGGPLGAAVGSMRTRRVRWDTIVRGISATLETGHVRLVKGRGGGELCAMREVQHGRRRAADNALEDGFPPLSLPLCGAFGIPCRRVLWFISQ